LRDLKHETNPIKEDLKIVPWHWSGPTRDIEGTPLTTRAT